jgi:hypothetical protein
MPVMSIAEFRDSDSDYLGCRYRRGCGGARGREIVNRDVEGLGGQEC